MFTFLKNNITRVIDLHKSANAGVWALSDFHNLSPTYNRPSANNVFDPAYNRSSTNTVVSRTNVSLSSIDIVCYNKQSNDTVTYVTVNELHTFKLDLNGTDCMYTITPNINDTSKLTMVKHDAVITEYSDDTVLSSEDDVIIIDEEATQVPIVYNSNIVVDIKNVGVLLEYFIKKDVKYIVDKISPNTVNIQTDLDMENISNIVSELNDSCVEVISKQCIRDLYDGYITDEDLEYLLDKYRSTKQERLKDLVKKR